MVTRQFRMRENLVCVLVSFQKIAYLERLY